MEQVWWRANKNGDHNEAYCSFARRETCKAYRKVRRVNSKARRANIPEYSSLISPAWNLVQLMQASIVAIFNLQYLDNIYFLGSLMQIICAIRMHIRAKHNIIIPFRTQRERACIIEASIFPRIISRMACALLRRYRVNSRGLRWQVITSRSV